LVIRSGSTQEELIVRKSRNERKNNQADVSQTPHDRKTEMGPNWQIQEEDQVELGTKKKAKRKKE